MRGLSKTSSPGFVPVTSFIKTALSKSGVAGTSRAMVKMRLREE
jgi:hypothetical protein